MIRGTLRGAAVLALLIQTANADEIDDVNKNLASIEQDVKVLEANVKKPGLPGAKAPGSDKKKLVDAQLALEVGDNDAAALALFNLVEGHQGAKDKSYFEAVYLLAQAFERKGDLKTAHSYLEQLVKDGSSNKYYQPSLEKLIDLSARLGKDPMPWVNKLQSVASSGNSSAMYILGRFEAVSGKHEDALRRLKTVPTSNIFYRKTQYLIGGIYVEQKKFDEAIAQYEKLAAMPAGSEEEIRINHLAHMAVGRIYHSKNDPNKAVAAYVNIPRKSPVFDTALYEVAWVYVKSEQYDKALNSLELLALTDAKSKTTPEVKLLEANLRIRKAQAVLEKENGNPKEELERALTIFSDIKNSYGRPHDELHRIISTGQDPKMYMSQLTGRNSESYTEQEIMPEIAAEWIRRRAEVSSILSVESDLTDVEQSFKDTNDLLIRLEGILNSPSRVSAFPTLAKQRRSGALYRDRIVNYRNQLLSLHRATAKNIDATKKSELVTLDGKRKRLLSELGQSAAAGEKAVGAQREHAEAVERLESQVAEIGLVLEANRANLNALVKYLDSSADYMEEGQKEVIRAEIAESRALIRLLADDHAKMGRDVQLVRDQLGYGANLDGAHSAKIAELADTYQEMHKILATGKSQHASRFLQTDARASSLDARIVGNQERIDKFVVEGLTSIVDLMKAERETLRSFQGEYTTLDGESRDLSSAMLVEGFKLVRNELRDVVVQADVGVIDVVWSRKEVTDEEANRLDVKKAREMRWLLQDFESVFEENSQ